MFEGSCSLNEDNASLAKRSPRQLKFSENFPFAILPKITCTRSAARAMKRLAITQHMLTLPGIACNRRNACKAITATKRSRASCERENFRKCTRKNTIFLLHDETIVLCETISTTMPKKRSPLSMKRRTYSGCQEPLFGFVRDNRLCADVASFVTDPVSTSK